MMTSLVCSMMRANGFKAKTGRQTGGRADKGKKTGLRNINILRATPINWFRSLRNTPVAESSQVHASDPRSRGNQTKGSQKIVRGK